MRYAPNTLLRRLIERGDLPTIPEVMARVVECVEDPLSDANDLTRILEADPAMTARALRLANSAFYGSRYQVDTLRRAVIILGFDSLKLIALATSVMDAFPVAGNRYWRPQEFWLHSLGTAKAAQLLAEISPKEFSPPTCFTAGLLHDIGKLTFAVTIRGDYERVLEHAHAHQCDLRHSELELLGTTHNELGAWVLEEWSFPPELVGAVRYQFHPLRYAGKHQQVPWVIETASTLALLAGYGAAGDFAPRSLEDLRLADRPLSEARACDIVAELQAQLPHAGHLLKVMEETCA